MTRSEEIMKEIRRQYMEKENSDMADLDKKGIRIIQFLPTLAYGDAIGNNVVAIDALLKKEGYETKIYAQNIDQRLEKGLCEHLDNFSSTKDDIILYHLSIGGETNRIFKKCEGKKWVIYHNVTPAHFFEKYDKRLYELCKTGLDNVKELATAPDLCIADSSFNKDDLVSYGYKCPIEVLPIIIRFEDYEKTPNKAVINKYSDDYVNIIFTGRISPNKKHEDIINAFYYYKKFINPKSRLLLIGAHNEDDNYYQKLKLYVEESNIEDVVFTGHIAFDEILAYYKVADVFLCMSEHEGFCVPLVEAMYFEVPIIAYAEAAVPETLGGSSILLDTKDPKVVAEAIDMVVKDEDLRKTIIANQNERLKDFNNDVIKQSFLEILEKYL